MQPQPDELFRVDAKGNKVAGSYDKDGCFMVDPSERIAMRDCIDQAGFLVDQNGKRIVDYQMKERIRKRSYSSA